MIERFRKYLTSKAAFTDDELEQIEAGAVVKSSSAENIYCGKVTYAGTWPLS
ncbi:hypothetical protein [Hymenobacter sp. GOD-10R]|uniref:hypothetical protein n=1 Tax=Hymenobacter sp. GOD-10R TaxID=3093922 RepID=UPI002D786A79|nr:hypothetical protein [Hymenobacter sp. GOD-10R]WRQ30673.1 hypothetical protein SD425_10415 [Hymenobacter sp. GOD-10R]